jgi:hypothetical protein
MRAAPQSKAGKKPFEGNLANRHVALGEGNLQRTFSREFEELAQCEVSVKIAA